MVRDKEEILERIISLSNILQTIENIGDCENGKSADKLVIGAIHNALPLLKRHIIQYNLHKIQEMIEYEINILKWCLKQYEY